MDISLVRLTSNGNRMIPLGLACLQAYLKANGIKVKALDLKSSYYQLGPLLENPFATFISTNCIPNHQDMPVLLPLADDLLAGRSIDFTAGIYAYLLADFALRGYESPQTTIRRYQGRFKFVQECVPLISKAPIVAFSVDYISIAETVMASAIIKSENPDTIVVWGGPAVTQSSAAFKLFLLRGVCDALVIGEGEQPLLEIAKGTELNKIDGAMVRCPNNDKDTGYQPSKQLPLDELPAPDYTGIELANYCMVSSVYTSRGCSHRCLFCAEWNLFGPRFRVKSAERVVDDIKTIINRYRPGYIIFGDSLTNHSADYFENLCDLLIKQKLSVKFAGHLRADLTTATAEKAALAGFTDAWVGFESFNETHLEKMRKNVELNQNLAAIEALAGAGINILAMLVVGFGTTEEEVANYHAVLKIIETLAGKKVEINGQDEALSIQFRPSPCILVPGSLNYKQAHSEEVSSWVPLTKPTDYADEVFKIQQQLDKIPYEYKRGTPSNLIFSIIRGIQEANWNARFRETGLNVYIAQVIAEWQKKAA